MDYLNNFTGGNDRINMEDLTRVPFSNQAALNIFFEPLKGAFSGLQKNFTIGGCEVTLNSGVTISNTAGYAYIDGDVVKVEAQSITHNIGKYYYFKKTTTVDSNGTKVFVDGISRDTWTKTRGVLTEYAAPQAGADLYPVAITGLVTKTWIEVLQEWKKAGLTTKIYNIGDWDMDATATINIAHGLSATEWKTVRVINPIIIPDDDSSRLSLCEINVSTGNMLGGTGAVDSTNIQLTRATGELFDNVAYDSTGFNRGYVTIEYIPD
jgi:hypothetical protein